MQVHINTSTLHSLVMLRADMEGRTNTIHLLGSNKPANT